MNEVWMATWPILQTVIVGLALWRIQHTVTKTEQKRRDVEKCREKYQGLMLRCSGANLRLSKITAKALRDGKTNGDVDKALEYAEIIEEERKQFLDDQATQKLI